MIVAFLISAWSVWMRPSTNACSFLASRAPEVRPADSLARDAGSVKSPAEPLLPEPEESPLDPLEGAAIGKGDEQRVVAGDRACDLGPASTIEGGRDRVGGAGKRAHDEQQARLVEFDWQIGQQLAEPILAGRF